MPIQVLNTENVQSLHDRTHAAHLLAEKLMMYKNSEQAIVVAIPNGGVPVGYHIAEILNLALQIIPCKKICHPADDSRSIGSVCIDEVVLHADRDIPQDYVQHQLIMMRHSMEAKERRYTGGKKKIRLTGKIVILVDDRLKTGDTMLACLRSIQKQHPGKIIIALPIITTYAAHRLLKEAHEIVCLLMPNEIQSTEEFFENYEQVSDEEVMELLTNLRNNY